MGSTTPREKRYKIMAASRKLSEMYPVLAD
jgi:hypothetical protein